MIVVFVSHFFNSEILGGFKSSANTAPSYFTSTCFITVLQWRRITGKVSALCRSKATVKIIATP